MNENGRRTLYLVAGVYLFYLGGKLVLQFAKGGTGNQVPSIIAGVVFLIAGIVLAIDYIKYKKREFLKNETEQEDEVQTLEQEQIEKSNNEEE